MPLPRLQLFELEDMTWFPHTLRDLATDYLHFMETRFALHKPVVPLLRAMLENSRTSCVVDLCSGGGGPVLAIYEELAADEIHVHFTLTDKFPNTPAFQRLSSQYPSDIQYIAGPVDATNVPKNLIGLRTMFNAFHHFGPRSARLVLESAVQARQPIGIFEIPERSLLMMVPFLFTPIFVALATLFIRPFRWKRLLWTYVIPLIPLTCWWDWSSIRMPRVYGRRDAGNDTMLRRLRVESGSHWSSRQGRAPYPSSGYPAFFANLVLVARLSLIQLKVNPPKRVSRSCQGKVSRIPWFRLDKKCGSVRIGDHPGATPNTGLKTIWEWTTPSPPTAKVAKLTKCPTERVSRRR